MCTLLFCDVLAHTLSTGENSKVGGLIRVIDKESKFISNNNCDGTETDNTEQHALTRPADAQRCLST